LRQVRCRAFAPRAPRTTQAHPPGVAKTFSGTGVLSQGSFNTARAGDAPYPSRRAGHRRSGGHASPRRQQRFQPAHRFKGDAAKAHAFGRKKIRDHPRDVGSERVPCAVDANLRCGHVRSGPAAVGPSSHLVSLPSKPRFPTGRSRIAARLIRRTGMDAPPGGAVRHRNQRSAWGNNGTCQGPPLFFPIDAPPTSY